MILLDKSQIRAQILAKRKALSDAQVSSYSDAILTRCQLYLQNKECIGMYLPMRNEADLTSLTRNKELQKKRFGIPRVIGDSRMEFVRWDLDMEMKRSSLGVLEPLQGEVILPSDFDVILVPLVAFHPNGTRIGYGRGYYDRYLSQCNALKIAVAYEFQRCDALIAQSHDIAMDLIITEQDIYCNQR